MIKNNRIVTFFFALFLIFFILGVMRLFGLRFEKGDVYPAYSSLRSDPLGTKILFEGIKITSPLTVGRNYDPVYRMETGPDTALFSLGMDSRGFDYMDREHYNAVSRFLSSGGRLIISFYPLKSSLKKIDAGDSEEKLQGQVPESEEGEPEPEKPGKNKDTGESGKADESGKTDEWDKDSYGQRRNLISLQKHWGFCFNHLDQESVPDSAMLESEQQTHYLPASIPHHTVLYFTDLDEAWKIIYTGNSRPVVIERKIGKGTIVLSADSYLFSNEALLKDRQTGLLAWFVGKNRHVLFDERHFGIYRQRGFSSLVRKYGLPPFFAGLFLVAILFVWKNATYLVPPSEDRFPPGTNVSLAAKDYAAGLISLLRRNIPERELLKLGFEEWMKSLGPVKTRLAAKIKKIEAVIDDKDPATHGENLVKKYQTICKILMERI